MALYVPEMQIISGGDGISAIKVTPEKLKTKAADFNDAGKEVKSITDGMFQLINQITGVVWSGAAADAYTKNFKALEDDCARMYEMITEFTQDLEEIAAQYIDAESANEEIGMSLRTDVIA